MIVLNFSQVERTVTVPFPSDGVWADFIEWLETYCGWQSPGVSGGFELGPCVFQGKLTSVSPWAKPVVRGL